MFGYYNIIQRLNSKRRIDFYIIVFYQAIKSVLEVVSLGSLYPLIYFMFNGNISIFNRFHNFNLENKADILVALLILIIIVFFIKTVLLIFFSYKENVYLTSITRELQIKQLSTYLEQDYTFFINNKNEELINNIITEVSYFAKNQVQPLYILINESIKIILIFIIILMINPFYTLISVMIFLPILTIFIKKLKKKIKEFGILRKSSSEKMMSFAFKGLNSIREILIFKNQKIFLQKFKQFCNQLQDSVLKNNLYQILPKILFEFLVVFYLMVIFFISLKFKPNSMEQTFIYLSFLSVSFVRLLPSVNTFVKNVQELSYYNNVTNILRATNKMMNKNNKISSKKITNTFNFENIEIKNLSYDFSGKVLFDNASFKIKKNLVYGVTGDSGSGKTTLFNILIGFLQPLRGQILVDKKKLSSIKEDWQNSLCYIPQDLYLFEDTIEKNITLSNDKINTNRLKRSIKISKLNTLISKYSKKIKHKIKNSGKDLSGGQRQRIGIARSLYVNRNTVFLDETTNALDSKIENEILHGLKNEFKNKTVFIISHSKDLYKYVDRVINIKDNKIKVYKPNAR
jgi:ABC-type multidrug transport system fused ATPase/permease subunit